jgi:hypothetical protein
VLLFFAHLYSEPLDDCVWSTVYGLRIPLLFLGSQVNLRHNAEVAKRPDEAEPEGGELRTADGDQDWSIELFSKRSSRPLQKPQNPLNCLTAFRLLIVNLQNPYR